MKNKALILLMIGIFVLTSSVPLDVLAEIPGEGREEQYIKDLDRLDKVFAVLERDLKKIKRSGFDVKAKAMELDYDKDKIFEFVRDKIQYESYYGSLRGGKGTLMGLAGNSLDQSILLAELLKEVGVNSRFVYGELEDKDAGELVAQIFQKPLMRIVQEENALTDDARGEEIRKMAVEIGIPVDIAKEEEQRARAGAESFRRELSNGIKSDYEFISATLKKEGVELKKDTDKEYVQLLKETKEHFWIQYLDDSGRWVDLDPCFQKVIKGQAMTNVINTYQELPKELFHSLRIVMTLQPALISKDMNGYITEIERKQEVLLDEEFSMSKLVGVNISLANVPANINPEDYFKGEGNDNGMFDSIKEFQPILLVGDEQFGGNPFDLQGNTYNVSQGQLGGVQERLWSQLGGGGGGGGLSSAFGALDQVFEQVEVQKEKKLLGQWVDYYIYSPTGSVEQRKEQRFRRYIIKPSKIEKWSSNGGGGSKTVPYLPDERVLKTSVIWSAQIMANSTNITDSFLSNQSILKVINSRDILKLALDLKYEKPIDSSRLAELNIKQFPIMLMNYYLISLQEGLSAAHKEFPDSRFYFNEPTLVSYERAFCTSCMETENTVKAWEGFDIISNRMRVVSNTRQDNDKTKKDDIDFSILKGVIETNVEKHLMASMKQNMSQLSGKFTPLSLPNTSTIFKIAEENQVNIVVLGKGNDALTRLEGLQVSEEAKEWIARDLEEDYLVIIPEKNIRMDGKPFVGWWRIAKKDGNTLGITESGKGQAATEYKILTGVLFVEGVMMCFVSKDGWGLMFCLAAQLVGIIGMIKGGITVLSYSLYAISQLIFGLDTCHSEYEKHQTESEKFEKLINKSDEEEQLSPEGQEAQLSPEERLKKLNREEERIKKEKEHIKQELEAKKKRQKQLQKQGGLR